MPRIGPGRLPIVLTLLATALDAVQGGFETRVLTGLCAGVAPGTTETALAEMRAAGVILG